ncbi:MAG: S24 family peptidase [Gammaproteobacteria bacterium]|nr:S24 family peptidase [Gammaproteobacteria bacterium]
MKYLPLYGCGIAAGFPSPADDHQEAPLSIEQHLITRPAATFLARANGDSMQGLGIFDRDLLIVDRSLEPLQGDVVVVALDGQLTCKVLDRHRGRLLSANEQYPPIPIEETQDIVVEGVVKASIRYHRSA